MSFFIDKTVDIQGIKKIFFMISYFLSYKIINEKLANISFYEKSTKNFFFFSFFAHNDENKT